MNHHIQVLYHLLLYTSSLQGTIVATSRLRPQTISSIVHSVLYKERKLTKEEKDFFRPALQIHVDFEDNKSLRIDVNDAGDLETLQPLVKELLAYHDSLFDEE